jgi:NO-binding membrane sensor protein with MHYT domain
MVCQHDLRLVVLSILISIMAAFAARELLGRINEARGETWLAWLGGTAIVDGIGTWSMHYTAKLACHLPVPLLLDWRMVLFSLLVAISGSATTLFVLT